MIVKLEVRSFFALLFLISLAIQGCAPSSPQPEGGLAETSTPGEVPTWTPRSQDLTQTALPTGTRPALIIGATAIPRTATATPEIMDTPKVVSVRIKGGNLSVRRGPSTYYNYIDVLKDGVTVIADGRDRVSRWIRIVLPSKPNINGWITTETKYTLIDGDIENLPYLETAPARPAFIRNCTKHEMWILPADVFLLTKFDEPDNEGQFPVGIYQVYDVENQVRKPIEKIDLSEGETAEIRYDWEGDKSKCE